MSIAAGAAGSARLQPHSALHAPAVAYSLEQGYFYEGLKPALVVASGDAVDVELVAAGVNACEPGGAAGWRCCWRCCWPPACSTALTCTCAALLLACA